MNKAIQLFRIISLIFILLAAPSGQAQAAIRRCRIDPHFHLSNGDTVTVTLDIGTDISNVRNVHYVLHVPAGVTVKSVTYTAKSDTKTIPETYSVVQGSPAKTYSTKTLVSTYAPGRVPVTVYARANSIKERAVSGYSGQPVFIPLSNTP